MNIVRRISKTLFLVICLGMMISFLPHELIRASGGVLAKEYQGKWTYFSVKNTIYKLNSETGKCQKIKTITDAPGVSTVLYYKGYLYFTVEQDDWEENNNYLCRIKPDGSNMKKLGKGSLQQIYNGQIYYIGYAPTCIARMELDGSKKTTIKKADIWGFIISGDKFYYRTRENIYACSLNGKKTKLVQKNWQTPMITDGKSIYYVSEDTIKVISGGNTKSKVVCRLQNKSNVKLLAARNRTVFYMDLKDAYQTHSYKYCSVNISTGEKKTIQTFSDFWIGTMILSKSGYNIIDHTLSEAEMIASEYTVDRGVSRMRIDGTGIKSIGKYYVP